MSKKIDLTGRRFGQLTVIAFVNSEKTTGYWLCRCDCGETPIISGKNLRIGNTKSCGCLKRRVNSETLSRLKLKHGYGGTLIYGIWREMIQRCTNPENKKFPAYGGRGIKVCERWLDVGNFIQDMGNRPSGKTLDRFPDNNGNYEPGNCRWATPKEQANNTRRNRRFTYNGLTMTLTGWAAHLGLTVGTLAERIQKWPLEEALSTPKLYGKRKKS